MNKAQEKLIIPFILIAAFIFILNWLAENVSGAFILISIALFITGFLFFKAYTYKKENRQFNELVLYTLNNRVSPDEGKRINLTLARSEHPGQALIRHLQILKDSIDIALTSKKRDIAESRIDLVRDMYAKVKMDAYLLTDETMSVITAVVSVTLRQFHTVLYKNMAAAHMEKADKLKTIKSKEKYAKLAQEIIIEGLDHSESDKQVLEREQEKIQHYLDSLTQVS